MDSAVQPTPVVDATEIVDATRYSSCGHKRDAIGEERNVLHDDPRFLHHYQHYYFNN